MDFFEALRERAIGKAISEARRWEFPLSGTQTIEATIKALEEMMVLPSPFTVTLRHGGEYKEDGARNNQDHTTFWASHQEAFEGHHGTDGEEVVVMVFRLS